MNSVTSVGVEPNALVPRPPSRGRFAKVLAGSSGTRDVPARRTPLSGAQAASALRNAWMKIHGEPPNEGTLSVLLAQWSHETGNGQSMYNFNFGGIKGTSPTGLSTVCRTREGYGATERTIRDSFRAYETPEDGAEDYLRLLQRRYGPALESARAGAPEEFVRALKRGGYFTGSEEAYVRSVSGLTSSIRANGFDAVGSANVFTEKTSRPSTSLSSASHGLGFSGVDVVDAVSSLTLGIPDFVARSATRILGDQADSQSRGNQR